MGRKGTGVELRDTSIRLQFSWQGQTVRETLMGPLGPMKPTAANHKAAVRLLSDIREQIRQGTFDYAEHFPHSPRAKEQALIEGEATTTPETFGALADLWLDSKRQLAPASVDQYATAIRFWKKLLGEKTPVKKITHAYLAAKIGKYPWKSPVHHNNFLIALRGTLALEFSGPRSGQSPMIGIKNMRRVKTLPDPLTVAERDALLADMKLHYDERVYAYFLWQFYTGMRPEETIALRWSDIDWNAQAIRVQRVRTFKGAELSKTKTLVQRDVDLLPQALQALKLMKPHTFMLRTERKGRDKDTAHDIFQNPVTRKSWMSERPQRDNYWKPSVARTGVRYRPCYNTRHTFASAALMTATAPAYVAAQLGHSVKMLFEKYARWIPGNDAGTARATLRAAMQAQMRPAASTLASVGALEVDAESVLGALGG